MLIVTSMVGCLPVRHFTQAVAGYESVNLPGVSIDEVVNGARLDKRTRRLLAHVPKIKAFGERHGLARTRNYERYVRLDRPAALWVVGACHPLSFRSAVSFGMTVYADWFDRAEAAAYARDLSRDGWDVNLRPSLGYSSLRMYDDPILSPMIRPGEHALGELADIVLHETLHATFYIRDQRMLSESVAAFFGDELAIAYLEERLGHDAPETTSFRAQHVRRQWLGAKMKATYEKLASLYASSRSDAEKFEEKRRILNGLDGELALGTPITNATLVEYRTYGAGQQELADLFAQCGSFARMLRSLERLRSMSAGMSPNVDPAGLLRSLTEAGCP